MRLFTVVCVCFLCLMPAVGWTYSDGDFQVWNTETEEWKINKDWKLAFEQEFRWGDSAHEFFYQHYDVSMYYSLNKYITLGGGYRYIKNLVRNDFKLEQEPAVMAAVAWDWKDFKFEDRNRFEYQHFTYQDDAWRYRNKFTVKAPWKFTRLEIQPYLADEIMVSFGNSKDEFNQNRASAGLGMKLTDNLRSELYYTLVTAKSSGAWKDSHVLGTKVKVTF
ncbi:MAG: DUF2490 domain-containing protein [Candidatus Omnitrophica bacterium]|nr:DUF2490 domain-containing protein [Candidatus Omnitrophota bacterium]